MPPNGYTQEVVQAPERARPAIRAPAPVARDQLRCAEWLNHRLKPVFHAAPNVVALAVIIASAVGTNRAVTIGTPPVRCEHNERLFFIASTADPSGCRLDHGPVDQTLIRPVALGADFFARQGPSAPARFAKIDCSCRTCSGLRGGAASAWTLARCRIAAVVSASLASACP